FDPEAGGEDSIEGRGRAAALHVSKFRDARLNVRAALNLGRESLADSAESIMTIDRDALLLRKKIFVTVRMRVLRHYHNRKGATLLFTLKQQVTNARKAKGMFGDKNDVGTA